MDADQVKDLKAELKALLDKYNVDIAFDCEGDTYGINSERVEIRDRKTDKALYSSNGYWLELD